MKTELRLPLETKWFNMTKALIKPEDYRSITPYWAKRFLNYQGKPSTESLNKKEIELLCFDIKRCVDGDDIEYMIDNWHASFKPFDINTMTLGYPKSTDTDRILKLEHKGIEIRTGNPEWGAKKGVLYFVIKHGEAIK